MLHYTFSLSLTGSILLAALATTCEAVGIKVSITNNAPTDGVYLTPVWVGFHNGSFDSYDGGLSSQPGLERIAEDGNVGPISADFLAGLTYIDDSGMSPVSDTVPSGQPAAELVDGAISNGGPLAPGEMAMATFDLDLSVPNRYISYASMVLPTSDYFIANGNPLAHSLGALENAPVGSSISFDIGLPNTINDAGTEVNDFATSAGNALFGIPGGQNGPNQGADENGVVANVATPFANFLNQPADFATNFPNLAFNDAGLYPNGMATVTITVVPEPSAWMLMALAFAGTGLGLASRRRRRLQG